MSSLARVRLHVDLSILAQLASESHGNTDS